MGGTSVGDSKDADVSKQLAVLRRKRTMAFNRLKKALEVGKNVSTDSSNYALFLSHFQNVEKSYATFEVCNLEILDLESSMSEEEEEEDSLQSQCDRIYYDILALHRNLVPSAYTVINESTVPITEASHNVHTFNNVKLPKITLPSYSGDIKKWPTFFDTFKSLIHNNNTLSDTERMHYLTSCLQGDALSLVSTYPVAGTYYQKAFDALVERYQNNRELAYTCWKEMLNFNLKANSPQEYRRIFDTFNENLKILETLNLPVDQWDFVLCYLVLSKLDAKTRCDFEEEHSSSDLPAYSKLKEFIYSKCEALVRDSHFCERESKLATPSTSNFKMPFKFSKGLETSPQPLSRLQKNMPISTLVSDHADVKATPKCSFCQELHSINNCQIFHKKSVAERHDFAKQNQWCFNCLKPSHYIRECKSPFKCQKCRQRHHTLLHNDVTHGVQHAMPAMPDMETVEKELNQVSGVSPTEENPSTLSTFTNHSVVMLSTAEVKIKDSKGNYQTMRALIDSGSMANFISESAVRRLGLSPSMASRNISALGRTSAKVSGSVTCCVGNQSETYFQIDLLTLPVICGTMPSVRLDTTSWKHVKNLQLADPQCHIPGAIDVLLGAEVFPDLLLPGRFDGEINQPSAINSIFGWLLIGRTSVSKQPGKQVNNNCCTLFCSDASLHEEMKKMWELEDFHKSSKLTPDEELCEKKYLDGVSRDQSGRYIVPLPFKAEVKPEFPGSRDIALRRFHLLERRLLKDPKLYKEYKDFLMDYKDNCHMSAVNITEVSKGKYYIPHHCISRPESETTRTRVVYDASAVCYTGQSLNEMLLTGARLQGNIITVLLRFRLHAVVFIGDVKQMFRQVKIRLEDQDYQRILWRFNPDTPIQEYRLETVTYGTSAAPYLACRTIKQLIVDEGDKFPLAAKVLQTDLYVDDVTTGSSSLEEARHLKREIVDLLKQGGFELRKWASNIPELLDDVRPEDCLHGSAAFDDNSVKCMKILGLKWCADNFIFDVQVCERDCTKRNILSELARIFDPMGFLSPITFLAKRLIQVLWVQDIGWDDRPPESIVNQWHAYIEQLPLLKCIRIPRRVTVDQSVSYQLHGFADGSEAGYGAVIYLRAVDIKGVITVQFICAKARVAPLKQHSLPRLELCAAVLLSDLLQVVKETYTDIPLQQIYAWSDSMVVLAWLRSHSTRWKTFVANRVGHIQETIPSACWHHVSSGDNAADVCSRGALPKDLIEHPLWWAGPAWLAKPFERWPVAEGKVDNQDIINSEERVTSLLIAEETNILDKLLETYSALSKMVRLVAYCLRLVHNLRNTKDKVVGPLSNSERFTALMLLVKRTQTQHFSSEIEQLRKGRPLPKPLRKLNPFVDDKGILRVGGRLARSGLTYEHKHPALLPRKCELTKLIIRETHRNNCHPGVTATHYLVSQQFWILSPRRAIQSELQQCVGCFRTNPKVLEPFMSDLPAARVNAVKPFSVVGVDFGGPFNIKHGTHRGAKIGKAYLCLFICFTTKAVHLEVVSDLSSEAFLAALRRFIARRGRCSIIHSDCGTNFVGAKNQLAGLMRDAAVRNQLEFRFNPPSAPHFGGVWEIQIKSAKALLYRTVGTQCLTFEELYTLFTQIESTMNSRPLCPLSSDPNDINVLTPGHFLTMEPLASLPEEDLTDVKLYRLNRWQLIQQLHQGFWKRWSAEYLNSLTQRAKWTRNSKPLKINSVVIVKGDNMYPLHWPLARVVELHPSPDGVIRQATVKTTTGTFRRPLVKLCPLPDNCD